MVGRHLTVYGRLRRDPRIDPFDRLQAKTAGISLFWYTAILAWRAWGEQFALFSSTQTGRGEAAMRTEDIVRVGDKWALVGPALWAGAPFYDAHVG